MRATIGERLGIRPDKRITRPIGTRTDDPVPTWVEPERAAPLRLAECPSSEYVPPHPTESDEELGPPRVRGEMVWLHKTAPVLVIQGRPDLSPEEHSSGRRR